MKILRSFGLAGALAGTLAIGGCSTTQTWPMTTAPRVPAAEGKVQVAAEKDGNHNVKLEVDHLAPPDRVATGASTYVVWLRPANGLPQNVGVLQVDKERKGTFGTKTPYRAFEILVTPESNPGATMPSTSPVMEASVAAPG